MTDAAEFNFDGLIGPTHNYAGLAPGNLASAKNAGAVSNPRAAALQGIKKMRALHRLGLGQGFFPPQERPSLVTLRALGFNGNDRQVIDAVSKYDPSLLADIYSASSMWTANAATVSPSADTCDGKVHFTPANLAWNFHRSIEPSMTALFLKAIFPEGDQFTHHAPLTGGIHFGDEGAANHNRLTMEHGSAGAEIFVFGEPGGRFPARQVKQASKAVSRLHLLPPNRTLFVQQSMEALDAGAFHNDVVCVMNENVVFLHERSFEERDSVYKRMLDCCPGVKVIEAPASMVSLNDAISSYVFNSQLVTTQTGSMALVLPIEAMETPSVYEFIQHTLSEDNPIAKAHFIDVRESMRNGGGPACLRLRVVLTSEEQLAVNKTFVCDENCFARLEAWVHTHYRDHLHPDDLSDPEFLIEAQTALDALTNLFSLGSFYDFQKN
ncbi:MAG: N-succinylarginine dihydrolase [Pseudomonadota bacterium]